MYEVVAGSSCENPDSDMIGKVSLKCPALPFRVDDDGDGDGGDGDGDGDGEAPTKAPTKPHNAPTKGDGGGTPPNEKDNGGGLSTFGVVLIVIGVVLLVAGGGVAAVWFLRERNEGFREMTDNLWPFGRGQGVRYSRMQSGDDGFVLDENLMQDDANPFEEE